MSYRVQVSHRAIEDVVRNAKWWAERYSLEKADEWQRALFSKIYSLDMFPNSHPVANESADFPIEIREAHFGLSSRPGYRVLFTIVDDTVNVLTVKANEEDWLSPDHLEL